eukprot:m.112874 g.112874  ORF g.112874 m.112874 type:complete len:392 (+) comp17048_c0_seq1:42-1217(+)
MATTHTCSSENCNEPAKMQCPSCVKLDIKEGSHFCAQECFKKSWVTHKKIHKQVQVAKKISSGPLTWDGFTFTGELRPWPQSPTRIVPKHIPRPDYAGDGNPKSERATRSRPIKQLNEEEIQKMRTCCRLGREVLDECAKIIAPGVTTDEIDRVCHEAAVARDCYPSPLNYHFFPKSCCTSVNEIICHGIPDGRALKDGDIVNVDITVYYDGMHGDLNETFLVGNVDDESLKLVTTTYECLDKAIQACKPGERYRDMGNIISKHAHANNFSVVRSYCGHGIHSEFHTAPSIPHYSKNKAPGVMKPGHCFTIEPMINQGVWGDVHWPDNWTAATQDGKRSAQFEHTLLVTETGVEVLTARLPTSPAGKQWFQSVSNADDTSGGDNATAAEAK